MAKERKVKGKNKEMTAEEWLKTLPPMTDEDRRKKALESLRISYQMHEKSKADMIYQRKNKLDKFGNRIYSDDSIRETLELMNTMQEDVKDKYLAMGGDPELLMVKPKKTKQSKTAIDRKAIFNAIKESLEEDGKENLDATPFEAQEGLFSKQYTETENTDDDVEQVTTQEDKPEEEVTESEIKEPNDEVVVTPKEEDKTSGDDKITLRKTKIQNKIQYDVIKLPSKGEGYANKINKIPVGDLTAYDENMILSPNMYQSGEFLDYLVNEKLLTDEITSEDLLPGDRDAIILWLRASGYGPEYPVTATDNKTGEKFNTVVDLTTIKYKKFTLKGDQKGWFDYTLPSNGDKIKFKFLTCGDVKELNEMEEETNKLVKKEKISTLSEELSDILENESQLDVSNKAVISATIKALNNLKDGYDAEEDGKQFSHRMTDSLIKSIMSINGVTDRDYIDEYVKFMNVRDSNALRKYIINNEPGLDFNITVEKPASLGGGSISMFLTIDQYLFLN